MIKKNWLRIGLAAMGVTALGAGILVGCSDDDPVVTPKADSGTDSSTTTDSGTDSGNTGTDAGTDAKTDSGPKPQPATLIAVNGLYDMGSGSPLAVDSTINPVGGWARVCYEITGAGIAGTDPLPAVATPAQKGVPGIPIGAGGAFPSTGVPLASIELTPYLVSAQALVQRGVVGDNGPFNCTQLLGAKGDGVGAAAFPDKGGPLVPNKHFWKLGTIPKGTLKDDTSFLLLITGCAADSAGGVNNCGSDFTGPTTHNFKVSIFELDRTAPAADEIGTHIIHGSTSAGALPVIPFFLNPDGGAPKQLSGGQPITFDNAVPAGGKKAPALVKSKGVNAATDVIALANPDGGAPLAAIPLTLTSGISSTPYTNGNNYTFVAVGTPGSPLVNGFDDAGAPILNLRSLHFVGYKNAP
jgi:hypothetical protein